MLERLLHREKPPYSYLRGFYTITLAPGDVRYLEFSEFCVEGIEEALAEIRSLSSNPTMESPWDGFKHPDVTAPSGTCVHVNEIDKLLPTASWDERLRVHHALGRLMLCDFTPSWVYVEFHRHLELGTHVAIAEFMEAWVKETCRDLDLAKSYLLSTEHIVIGCDPTGFGGFSNFGVYRKTSFVQSRLDAIAADEKRKTEDAVRRAEQAYLEAEARQADVQAESLRRSRFPTFVYIMEDTRNKAFKIGRSRTPGKRERTLQSEVPETALRFSIPAEEKHEKALHARFAHRRIRGEWFELSTQDLVDAVTFLKAQGDAERAEADFHWLGGIFLRQD
jgi:hypothetical protein